MTQHAIDIAPPTTPVDAPLLDRVLQPYRAKNCTYLQSLRTGNDQGVVRGEGEFAIAQSCYIDDTGHLNAAEVIICFNQVLYTLLAISIRDRLIPALADWTEDEYWARQLDGVLITRQSTTFTRPISPRAFHGEVVLGQALTGRLGGSAQPLVSLQTRFRFGDDGGGACHGEVRVAVVR
jgi:FcoT-like thioesterase domain